MVELLSFGGVTVDAATIQRRVFSLGPLGEGGLKKRRIRAANSWRMVETYIKAEGEWVYLYGAVDKEDKTVDFLLVRKRNKIAAHKFLLKAINNSCPKVINIDKSGANREAIKTYNKRRLKRIRTRQCKYLNNRVEEDHRFLLFAVYEFLN